MSVKLIQAKLYLLNIDFIDNKGKLFELTTTTAKITFEETFSQGIASIFRF